MPPIEAVPTLQAMIAKQGWTDMGNHSGICRGKAGQPTCQSKGTVREARIDYIFTNQSLTPCVEKCWVDQSGTYPAHRPLLIDSNVKKAHRATKQLLKPTNFAELFEESLQKDIDNARAEHEQKQQQKVQRKSLQRKRR